MHASAAASQQPQRHPEKTGSPGPGEVPPAKPGQPGASRRGAAAFLAVAVQFALVVLLIDLWQVETLALERVMQLALAGFIVHHLLPQRFRLPFFALLSLAATVMVLGEIGPKVLFNGLTGKIPLDRFLYHLLPGCALVLIGLALLGICHLPVRWGLRVALLALAAAGLAVVRANAHWFPDVSGIWVILGSMFIFRLMVYMYDLKNRAAPFGFARGLAYFFMLPNVCFPLYPLVDYKTFCTTYYNEDWARVYQTGLSWMLRGVFQLLLYQAVYQFAPLDISSLTSSVGAAGFVLGTYMLYLHVSGQFHLIVGLLHMFGFNLPETHHLYLLASSFTDFWRRINIYWKDFIMKLFFYPTFFRLRKLGTLPAMALATLVTFFLTWLLHSWQWFWIRGSFLFTWQDISFWAILAALVLVNALYEATWGSRRKLSASKVTLRERLVLGLKTVGTFTVICLLWTLWSCQSWDEIRTIADAASDPAWWEVLVIVGFLAAVGVAGMVWGRSSRDTSEGRSAKGARPPFHFWRSAAAVSAGAACLLALPPVAARVSPTVERVVVLVRQDALNAGDLKRQRRGYYEELELGRDQAWREPTAARPLGWHDGRKVFYQDRQDFLLTGIAPSVATVMGGVEATTNSLGMRDREYPLSKPAGTYRVLLLGASHDQGTGVPDAGTYENLVEDRLNEERALAGRAPVEILNLSVGGYSVLQRLARLEMDAAALTPDAVLMSVAATDRQFVVEHLSRTLKRGIAPPDGFAEFLDRVARDAGVNGRMPDLMIERRLQGEVNRIYAWVFQRFAESCEQRGILPVVIFRPAPVDFEGIEESERREMLRLAGEAGLTTIDLSPAFDGVVDRKQLILAEWDQHTTPLGHRLLAEVLHDALVPLLDAGSPGEPGSTP